RKQPLILILIFLLMTLLIACTKQEAVQEIAYPDSPQSFADGFFDGKLNCCLTLSPDGQLLLFEKVNGIHGQLLLSNKTDDGWTEPEPVPFGSNAYSEGTPYFSPDGSKLYYTSTRPLGGSTDYNIWYVERVGTDWSEPVALPPLVNSSEDEYGPTVTSDG